MSEKDERWIIPTAEQIAAEEQKDSKRQSGTFSWVKKLRLRTQVRPRRTMFTAPSSIDSPPLPRATLATPISVSDRPPLPTPVPDAVDPIADFDGDEVGVLEALRPAPPSTPIVVAVAAAKIPAPKSTPLPSESPVPERPRPKVKISEKVRDQRTGRATKPTAPPPSPKRGELSRGHRYGICTCGQEFHGPDDIVTAEFTRHECGKDKGFDRDPVFDR